MPFTGWKKSWTGPRCIEKGWLGVARRFSVYVALGDSMSTDHYPTCDVRDLDLPPDRLDPLGAAALLFRNDDVRWPEFSGRDLERRSLGVKFLNLAEDGAMIDDVTTE